MRTAEERIEHLHKRAHELKMEKARRENFLLGSASTCLMVCLIGLIRVFAGHAHNIKIGDYTGSMMLFESAGGYVTVAVAAFVLGMLITAFLIKRRHKG